MYLLTDEEEQLVFDLRSNYTSIKDISEVTGYHKRVIERVCKSLGFPPKLETWNLPRLLQIADGCMSYTEFREVYPDAYQGARKNDHHVTIKKHIEERDNGIHEQKGTEAISI